MQTNSTANSTTTTAGFNALSIQYSDVQGVTGPLGPNGPSGSPMALMSCDALLAYLETRLGALSDRIREKMDISTNRGDAMAKMNRVSRELAALKAGTGDKPTAIKEIKELIEAHGTDGTMTKGQVEELNEVVAQMEAADVADVPEFGTYGWSPSAAMVNLFIKQTADVSDTKLDSVIDSNNKQVDALGKTDGMALTELSMLVSQMSQATGLVSNMMASFNESTKSIIAKIG
jgi:hypothetical protein